MGWNPYMSRSVFALGQQRRWIFCVPSVSDLDEPQSDRPEPLTRAVFGPTHFPCSLTPNSEVYHNSLTLLSNFLHRSMCLLCAVAQNPHSGAQGFYTWEIIIKWGHLGPLFFACSFVYCRRFACCPFPTLPYNGFVVGREYVHILLSAPLSPDYSPCPFSH